MEIACKLHASKLANPASAHARAGSGPMATWLSPIMEALPIMQVDDETLGLYTLVNVVNSAGVDELGSCRHTSVPSCRSTKKLWVSPPVPTRQCSEQRRR